MVAWAPCGIACSAPRPPPPARPCHAYSPRLREREGRARHLSARHIARRELTRKLEEGDAQLQEVQTQLETAHENADILQGRVQESDQRCQKTREELEASQTQQQQLNAALRASEERVREQEQRMLQEAEARAA